MMKAEGEEGDRAPGPLEHRSRGSGGDQGRLQGSRTAQQIREFCGGPYGNQSYCYWAKNRLCTVSTKKGPLALSNARVLAGCPES